MKPSDNVILVISKGYARYRQDLMLGIKDAIPSNWFLYHTSTTKRPELWELDDNHPETANYCHRDLPRISLKSVSSRWHSKNRDLHSKTQQNIETLAPKLIIIQEFSLPMLKAIFLAKIKKIPCVAFSDLGKNSHWWRFSKKNYFLHKFAPYFTDALVAQTPIAQTPLTSKKRPTFFAPHCINIETFSKGVKDCKNENPEKFRLLLVGTYDEIKGHDYLADALSLLPAKIKASLEVALVGRGDSKWVSAIYESRGVSDLVKVKGTKQGSELFQEFANADTFILPSRSDTFGVVIHEACAAGLPIIVSKNVGSAGVLVEHKKNGLIVDPEDSAALCDSIVNMVTRPAERARYSQHSKALANKYNAPNLGANLVEWLSTNKLI